MPPFDSLQSVSKSLESQQGPEPEELKKGKEDLKKILTKLAEKEKEIEKSADPAEKKSERYAKIAEVLKTQVLPVLQSWLGRYPEREKNITNAVKIIEALIVKYEQKSAGLKKQAESTQARQEIKKTIKTPIPNPFEGLITFAKDFHLPEVTRKQESIPQAKQAQVIESPRKSAEILSPPKLNFTPTETKKYPSTPENTEVVSQFPTELEKLSEKMQNGDTGILIDGNGQNLFIVKKENGNFTVITEYKVSTGKRGFKPSGGNGITPLGLFRIDAMPKGAIGQLVATGSVRNKRFEDLNDASDNHGKAVMTTAALHLEGEEKRNSVYHDFRIHGTNYESRIGRPASGGCIRTKNSDILEIYEFAQTQKETGRGLYVYITNRNPLEEVRHQYASR